MEDKNNDTQKSIDVANYLMLGQAELLDCLSAIEKATPQLTIIFYELDLEISKMSDLKKIDNLLSKYILTWQDLQKYYQYLLKIRNDYTLAI